MYLLRLYYVPGTDDGKVNKQTTTKKKPSFRAYILVENVGNNKRSKKNIEFGKDKPYEEKYTRKRNIKH